ncbi:hypothetical protein KIW84_040601 [Lathyrus oleraceus]|uniref:Reverse transcriptase n=1 Tax=Pisum sativum TaxID=3888 RepID=A0A9D4X7Y6_PEA|nr:hypothetical protein KIW84_040601 [Pisum sativum]
MRELKDMSNVPWCIVGDFNDLLSQQDKIGNHIHPNWLCVGFCQAESLGRALVKPNLMDKFPNAKLIKLMASHFDHSPNFLHYEPVQRRQSELVRWNGRNRSKLKENKATHLATMEAYRGGHDAASAAQEQSAFVEVRYILDNSMIAIEIIHALKRRTSGNKAHLALKIDINKAYDMVDWGFLIDGDILDAPLVGEVVEGNFIWKEEQDGKYNIKSGYRLWREVQANQRERKVEGD